MIRPLRGFSLLALLMLGAALLAACGGDDDTSSSAPSPAATAAAEEEAHEEAVTIDVTLSEWAVEASDSEAHGNEFTFKATNSGAVPHELVIIGTDLAADALPATAGTVDEGEVEVIGRIAQFAAGTESATFTLDSGSYVLICNVPGHYGLGMATTFTVE